MNTLKSKEDEVLNYFINRSTNAAAESLNSKMKGFRSELRECVTCLSISSVVPGYSVSSTASHPRTISVEPRFFRDSTDPKYDLFDRLANIAAMYTSDIKWRNQVQPDEYDFD